MWTHRATPQVDRHLAEVSRLLGRALRREDLLSLLETEEVLRRAKEIARSPAWKREVAFMEKDGPRFRKLLNSLEQANQQDVYLWTPLALHCGLPKPVPLSQVDFGFPFDINPEGILEVFTFDVGDRLLLDYSCDQRERQLLEIEVSGARWGRVQY